MPAPQTDYANFTAATVNIPTVTETVVWTTKPVSSPASGSAYFIQFWGEIQGGTGTTITTFRIREGSLTGTTVLTTVFNPGITGRSPFALAAIDTLVGDVAGAVWVLTIAQTGATGNGQTNYCAATVTVPC